MTAHLAPTADGYAPPPGAHSAAPALPGAAQALLDAVLSVASDLDLGAVLGRLVESATELTAARYGALAVVGPDGRTLVDLVTKGGDEDLRATFARHLSSGTGIVPITDQSEEVLRLDDLTTHARFRGFPEGLPAVRTFLGMPIRIRGTLFGHLYLAEKAGGTAFTEQDEVLVHGLAAAAGFVIENARAYAASERRRRWLEAWADLADELQPPAGLDDALHRLVRTVRTVSGVLAVAVLHPGQDDGRTISSDRLDRGVVDSVLDEVERAGSGREVVSFQVGELCVLAVPLRSHLAPPSVLVSVCDRTACPGRAEERELLTSFADQAALALDRIAAYADREELAVISDRERIARDLHDTVIQRLFATGLQLQGTALLTSRPDVAERLEQAVSDLDLTIRDIRGTIFELQHRHAGSVRAEIRTVVDEYAPALGFRPVVRTSGPVDTVITATVRARLVAVLRDAVADVVERADATAVEVELAVVGSEVRLTVSDDGHDGPAAARVELLETKLGQARRQALALGGDLQVLPHEPTGVSVVWHAPVG
ncbi:GAF domain-containing sensor histidine kinase [Nocardioides panaciterrulae]|uniref:Signal transduction histidine kinase n=1 Tax=Nocardioides panaciterrulae TaxID=661492 RepID=A0A7Y9E8U7_9ACTN|nr:GAF domain-containing sensor histidine kinase [Nocardioides panaciterrulae]NYD43040.1 signal transduction histidine kinase [Nocardioides panaciterrulae]